MPIYAIWFVAALALLVLELASTTFFSIFLAIGAFAAGLLAFFLPDSPIWVQAVLAIAVASLGVVVGRPFLRQRLRRHGEPPLTTSPSRAALPSSSPRSAGRPSSSDQQSDPSHRRQPHERRPHPPGRGLHHRDPVRALRVLPVSQHGQSRPAGVRRCHDAPWRVPGHPCAGARDH